jgi:hypothetical protein
MNQFQPASNLGLHFPKSGKMSHPNNVDVETSDKVSLSTKFNDIMKIFKEEEKLLEMQGYLGQLCCIFSAPRQVYYTVRTAWLFSKLVLCYFRVTLTAISKLKEL